MSARKNLMNAVEPATGDGKTAYTLAARAGRRDIMEWLADAKS